MSGPSAAPDIARIRTDLQQIITGVMGDGLHAIPADVPILDLGVGSLALVEGMRQVYDRFGVLVSIRRVIEGQITIGSLALYIEQELSSQGSSRRQGDPAAERNVEREIPIAASQQHLAFLSRYSAEAGAAFHEALPVRLSGPLHGPALHAALEEVGRRYEALRTALDPDGNSLQIITGEALELNVSAASDGEMEGRLSEIVSRPFEQGARLFRAELLRLAETDHLLVLVGHALVLDQQALIIVLNDIAGLYNAYARDEQGMARPAVLQWTDYLSMGQTPEAKEARRASERYWNAAFTAAVSRPDLPADRPRPAVKKYSGSRVDLPLSEAIHVQLQSLAASEGLAPESLLFGAFGILLHRLSDAADLSVGVESEPLYPDAGLPVVAQTHNMLAPRTEYDPKRSFREHLRRAAQSLAGANAHRHLSLGELIQMLRVPRDQSRSPLFGSAFRSWAEPSLPAFGSLQAAYVLPPSSGARYDLEMIAITAHSATRLVCDFSSELFDPATISRWLQGLAALLDTALQKPDEACGVLPLMTAAGREQILSEWNKTEVSYPSQQTVLDLILEQATQRREQVAVRFGASSLTYAGLVERMETVARALHQAGVTRGDRVGILMKRSLDLIPAMLAVWRLGAMFVPMDIGFPGKRIADMLEDAAPRAVITQEELASLLGEKHRALAVWIEQIKHQDSTLAGLEPAKGSDSAHIIYTSGSTGRPKGVEIRHRALLNCLLATRRDLQFVPGNSMLALTTISFDISANELFMPLMAGGTVDLAEDGLAADGLQLRERIEQRRPSHLQATPSTWKSVLQAGWKGGRELCLASAGEALGRDLAEELLQRCGALWNLYGPTETTVYSSIWQVQSAPDQPVRIGSPLPNTRMYILDHEHQPVPVGAIGELYIAGEGVAAGYWNRPELTRERFLENPFVPGDRMYRTGDLARFLPDGQIICLGRADDQVKIHGVRVEPGEIETVLRGLPGVQDAAVTSWIDSRGDRQLVAHIIAADKEAMSSLQIRTRLRAQLPEVMIPPHILFADSLPRTANGKVHRAALPAPDETRPAFAQMPLEAPATSTERELARIWGALLRLDAGLIGRDSDFMDLGGHSLLMTLLMIEVRRVFQISFSLREFFGASTLRKCAALIDDRSRRATLEAVDRARLASSRTAEWARQRMAYLQRESELPAYLAPARGLVYKPSVEIGSVLLTGATGFLGSFIVAEILKTTKAHLYCLVRPRRGEDSKQRIEQQMKRYQVWADEEAWTEAWRSRLHVVDGDVTLPRLGMRDSDYERLAREVEAIFHGAAHVNFIYPYEALRATNVLGVHEIIQFALYSRIKPVHYLSTAAIWPMGAHNTYLERDPIDHYGLLNLGYDESKWVGEKCLLQAEQRGLPVARYRPGEVGGDSLTGHCVTDHFVIACLKGFLQFGAFPALDMEVDVAPVDYVARAMVHLAFRRDPLGCAFHLTNPTRRTLREGLAYLRRMGYRFEELPFVELRDRLLGSRDFASNSLFAYQAALEDMDDLSMQLPTYDTRETQRELGGSGITCPPADEKLFGTYLRYLQGIGFIPQPEALWSRA